MRNSITILMVLLFSISANAQRGAIEILALGGPSINSNPSSNMAYKGENMTLNYTAALQGLYNVHRSISVGVEFRTTELSRISDSVYFTYLKTNIGGDGKRFTYSKMLLSASVVANGKLNLVRGYFYGGVALGYGMSTHDSKKLSKNESYRAPNGGNGFSFGTHIGYTYGINPYLGLNIEGSLRNYTLSYDAGAPEVFPYTNLKYNITAYSITVGLKVRIMPDYGNQNYIPAFRGKGRSMQPRRP